MDVKNASEGFQKWTRAFFDRAQAAGLRPDTLTRAFDGVTFNQDVIAKDRNQSEFTKQIWEYLKNAASPSRIENGQAALETHAALLDRIEARYGVDRAVVVAIWGLESAYGTRRGDIPTIEALATLAHEGRRGAFFEAQLIEALKIIQTGDVTPADMIGSWAGAMGHTQFIPTSYQAYAVDFDRDGKRDIWSDDPTDALASTAAYLNRFGWVKGQPWGVEVILPEGFDYTMARKEDRKSPSDWAKLGVLGTDGRAIPDHGDASILLPAGHEGAAFMIFKNFDVIARYNNAQAYVIGVGHLADRITGGPEIQALWPLESRALIRTEIQKLQKLLTQKGFDTQGADGLIGPRTIRAIRAYQSEKGLIPDGYPSTRLLDQLTQ